MHKFKYCLDALIMTHCIDNKRYLAGGFSGIIEVVSTHPLDYVKTKKQEYAQRNISKGNFYKYQFNYFFKHVFKL